VTAAGASRKFITYFTNWAQYRQGDCKYDTSMIQGNLYTHINFAFAKVDASTFAVQPYDPTDVTDANAGVSQGTYDKVNSLKSKYPHLKTLISLGGWSFGATIFSQMSSSASNRAAFISSAMSFARKYNFDGVDIDWEYPANEAQGGRPEDKINFSSLLREFRAAIESENRGNKGKLLLTIAAPAGAASFAGIQLEVIHQYLDWINLMTYDMHGSWEPTTGFNTPLYCPPGDTVCIDYSVDAYLKAGTPPGKLVLGLGTYGRSWTLASTGNTNPGAPANGPGNSGQCSGEGGILSYYEVKEMVAAGATVKYDAVAVAQYAYLGNQWVSYDSPATIKSKIEYVSAKALGGAMVWALDLDAPRGGFYELQCAAASNLFGSGAGGNAGATDSFNSGDTFRLADQTGGASEHPSLVASVVFAALAGAAVFFALATFH
jgi:chitinase